MFPAPKLKKAKEYLPVPVHPEPRGGESQDLVVNFYAFTLLIQIFKNFILEFKNAVHVVYHE